MSITFLTDALNFILYAPMIAINSYEYLYKYTYTRLKS